MPNAILLGTSVASEPVSRGGRASPPKVGETIAGYRLEEVLGRGRLGAVFLASELALGDRSVVVKISRREGCEHLVLASLRHPHIVPVHAVHEDRDRDLRILARPDLGGATLERILEAVADRHPADRAVDRVLRVVDEPLIRRGALPSWSDARQFLMGLSYHQAAAWIGVCLAEALHSAHMAGIVHLDVKPSNILLTEEGRPMLLDFHLARPPVAEGTAPPLRIGGTPGYMAPEQSQALESSRRGDTLAPRVDARADVYGLGAVMFEALGGSPPPGPDPKAAYLLKANPKLGSALAAAVTRCLARDPSERYQSGADLAADLRYYLGLPRFPDPAGPSRLGIFFRRLRGR